MTRKILLADIFKNKTVRTALAAVAFVWFALPVTAEAACEQPGTASSWVNWLANQIPPTLNPFIQQEKNFSSRVAATANPEMLTRLDEFDTNIRSGMSGWWNGSYLPALRSGTAQLGAAQEDQARMLGTMMDANIANETIGLLQENKIESNRRYRPDENSCQIDSAAPDQNKKYRLARALAGSYASEDTKRRSNAKSILSARSTADDQKIRWQEFMALFCDPAKGDIGCAAPGVLAGRNTALPDLLWGDQQTIDMSVSENRTLIEAALRTMISPKVQDAVLPGALSSADGQAALLARRAQAARLNTVYNVMGQMLAERAGSNNAGNTYIREIREAAGLPIGIASSDPSYREIMRALTKERFRDPEYIVRMIQDPESLLRLQGSTDAVRAQQLSDLYKRLEEMVVMEAASFADDLDKKR